MEDKIEDHVGVTQSDAFEQATTGESVTTKHLFADGGEGKEKEATLRRLRLPAAFQAPSSSMARKAMLWTIKQNRQWQVMSSPPRKARSSLWHCSLDLTSAAQNLRH